MERLNIMYPKMLNTLAFFSFSVDGAYSPWSDWTPCTVTCGGGESLRSRQCSNPSPEFGGRDCSSLGSSTETIKCKIDPCPGRLYILYIYVYTKMSLNIYCLQEVLWTSKSKSWEKGGLRFCSSLYMYFFAS